MNGIILGVLCFLLYAVFSNRNKVNKLMLILEQYIQEHVEQHEEEME